MLLSNLARGRVRLALAVVVAVSACASLPRAREQQVMALVRHECAVRMTFARTRADSLNVLDHAPTYAGKTYAVCAMWVATP